MPQHFAGPPQADRPTIAVITVSDRSARGLRQDVSGPLAARLLDEFGEVGQVALVADSIDDIRRAILDAIAAGARVVLTTGGTGITSRDVTPEATAGLLAQRMPGIEHLLRDNPRVPGAAISRGLAGVVASDGLRAFVVNAPGSPGGVRDAVGAIGPRLAHIVDQLDDGDHLPGSVSNLGGAESGGSDSRGAAAGRPDSGGAELGVDAGGLDPAGAVAGGADLGGSEPRIPGLDGAAAAARSVPGGGSASAGKTHPEPAQAAPPARLASSAHTASSAKGNQPTRPDLQAPSAHEEATRRLQNRGRSDGSDATVALACVSAEPIDVDRLAELVDDPGAGAVVTFRGQVRNHDEAWQVTAIEYETHPQAGEVIGAVAAVAGRASGANKIAVAHRTGRLVVGDVALAVAVSASHRGEALRVMEAVIEGVKMQLPVWKKQIFADGTSQWSGRA